MITHKEKKKKENITNSNVVKKIYLKKWQIEQKSWLYGICSFYPKY